MRLLDQRAMNALFEVLDELEVDRERVTVPLERVGGGGVRRLGNGRIEITLPDVEDLGPFLASLREELIPPGG